MTNIDEMYGVTIKYTKHARERMREHNITEQDIENIRDYGNTENESGNRTIKRIGKKGKGKVAIIRKFLDKHPPSILIITTWDEKKVRREKRRRKFPKEYLDYTEKEKSS